MARARSATLHSEEITPTYHDGESRMIEYVLGPMLVSLLASALWYYRKRIWHLVRLCVRHSVGRNNKVGVVSLWDLNSVYAELAQARSRVFILQTWFPRWKDEHDAWEQLMRNLQSSPSDENAVRFDMKVLLLDPSLHHARLRARGDLKDIHVGGMSMLSSNRQAELRTFVQRYRSDGVAIDIALYNSLPFGPIYIIDDHVYWGLFVSDKDSMRSLCFDAPANSTVGKVILGSFLNAWKTRSSTLGPSLSSSERQAEEREVAQRFNGLRDRFSRFSLLGRVRVSNAGEAVPESRLVTCLRRCLRTGIPTLVVMRHAATSLNEAGIFSGLLPVNLSQGGVRQLEQLGTMLPDLRETSWTSTYCSTVTRTKQTLELLLRSPGEIVPRRELDERNIGELEGCLKSEIEESSDERRNCWKFFWEPRLGESYARLLMKLCESGFLDEVTDNLVGDKNILVCTHEGPLKIIRMILEATEELGAGDLDVVADIEIRNCDVYVYIDSTDIATDAEIGECLESAKKLQPAGLS